VKRTILLFVTAIVAIGVLLFVFIHNKKVDIVSPLSRLTEKPLEKYSFSRLKETKFEVSKITFDKVLKEGDGYTSYLFYFTDQGKRVSGMANVPKAQGVYPVIVMFRGFIEKDKYSIGEGTRHSGEVFAQNGFITLAPDFLGYGSSDNPSNDSIEERFQTYTTGLTLLNSLSSINNSLSKSNLNVQANLNKVGIWGHSNGGHIALSVLEISGKPYPTVLWNPVSKPFPYSILYFTDDFDDHGKALIRVVADFERYYDAEKYSLTNYFRWIKGPIQLSQAVEDEAVPKRWSDTLNDELKKLKKDIEYNLYPGEDHNFSKGSWSTVVGKSIDFYKRMFNP